MAKAPQLHLEAASVLSLLDEKKKAVAQLELAIQNGYTNCIWLKINPDLLPLRGYPAFEQLLAKVIPAADRSGSSRPQAHWAGLLRRARRNRNTHHPRLQNAKIRGDP